MQIHANSLSGGRSSAVALDLSQKHTENCKLGLLER